MAVEIEIDFDEPIPVFPLAQLVLLPHATVPLQIFEPRYRAMTRHALEHDGLIAMGVLEGDHWMADDAGNPAIKPCVCVGRIVRHQELEDGRFHLLLQGLVRARMVEELPTDPEGYRSSMLTPLEGEPAMEIDLAGHREQLSALAHDDRLGKLAMMKQVRQWLGSDLPTAAVLDVMALALCRDAGLRYAMLAEPDAVTRAERLIAHLESMRRTLDKAEPMARHVKTDEGFFLN